MHEWRFNMYSFAKRFYAFCLAMVISCSTLLANGVYIENSGKSMRDNGAYSITQYNGDVQIINEYDAEGVLDTSSTVEISGDSRIAITDDGTDVFKTIYNTATGETQMYQKASGAPDSEFRQIWETTTEDIRRITEEQNSTPLLKKVCTDFYFGTCFEYKYYAYDDNSHNLIKGNVWASTEPNQFLSECTTFKQAAKRCDTFTYNLAKDIFGFIPGGTLLMTVGEMIYEGAILGRPSDSLGTALYNYVLAVAGTVCKPAVVIGTLIDGGNLLYYIRQVQYSWETVYNG